MLVHDNLNNNGEHIMKLTLFFTLMLTFCQAIAQEIYPKGCMPLVIKNELVTLSTKKPRIVMLHNLSNKDLWITHPTSSSGASAGWSSRLEPQKWSVLALNTSKSFTLSCIESTPGHEQQIPCASVIAVCKWPSSSMKKETSSTFWAGENMELSPLIAYIERRGFTK